MTNNAPIGEDQNVKYASYFEFIISALTRQSYLTSPMIKVTVGDDKASKLFSIHEGLIKWCSYFFRKALRKHDKDAQWLEGEGRIVKLPDDDAKVFAAYLQLLYYDRVPPQEKAVTEGKSAADIGSAIGTALGQEYNPRAALYVFAEKIQDDSSKDFLFSAFIEASQKKRANEKS
jgi:hypothetical protein